MSEQPDDVVRLVVEVQLDDVRYLSQLVGEGDDYIAEDLSGLAWWLLKSAADGVRRPGSWERGWIQQATGASL